MPMNTSAIPSASHPSFFYTAVHYVPVGWSCPTITIYSLITCPSSLTTSLGRIRLTESVTHFGILESHQTRRLFFTLTAEQARQEVEVEFEVLKTESTGSFQVCINMRNGEPMGLGRQTNGLEMEESQCRWGRDLPSDFVSVVAPGFSYLFGIDPQDPSGRWCNMTEPVQPCTFSIQLSNRGYLTQYQMTASISSISLMSTLLRDGIPRIDFLPLSATPLSRLFRFRTTVSWVASDPVIYNLCSLAFWW